MTAAQPPQPSQPPELNSWKPYDLDHYAQILVIKNRDKEDVLKESHKMRMAVAYGLERFWGERFRLERNRQAQEKANYWKEVWKTLADEILKPAGIELPNDEIQSTQNIQDMADSIWKMKQSDREIALMVLAQFCDSLVWWTQRYKKNKE